MKQPEFDVGEVVSQAKKLVGRQRQDITEPLTRNDIARWTNQLLGLNNNNKHAMSYGKVRSLDTRGVLSPDIKETGTKAFHYYSIEDLENIVSIKILEVTHGVPFRQAIANLSAWRFGAGQIPPSPTGLTQITDRSTITGGAQRAHRYIWSRSLNYILTLIFGELPPDTYVFIERLTTVEDKRLSSSLTRINNIELKNGLLETSPTTRAVRITAGSMCYIEPFLTITDDRPNVPEIFAFYDDAEDIVYHLSIYTASDVPPNLSPDGERLLTSLGSYQGNMMSVLLGLAFRHFSSPTKPEDLPAMTEAIVQALPEFDHCGILLSQKGQYVRERLGFRYYTKGFPEELKTASVISGDLVAGWVHQNRLPLFIERLEPNDGRVSELEKNFTAIAAAPIWTRDSRGVCYAVRQRKIGQGEKIFSPITKDLFSMLAAIFGEMAYNESLFKENTTNAVRAISRGSFRVLDGSEMIDQLKTEFTLVQDGASDEYKGVSLAAIVIAIENFEEIVGLSGTSVADWLEQQVLEIGSEVMDRGVRCQHSVFRLRPGRFVVLLPHTFSTEDEIRRVTMNLRDILRSITLTTPYGPQSVELLSWRIVYPYNRYLRRKLCASKKDQSAGLSPEQLAEALYARFEGAARAMWHNLQGHEALERHDFPAAFNHFADARAIDPESPYYLKHLAEALKEDGQFGQALSYCEEALKLDPDYAGGHYMMAEILASLGKIDEASFQYQTAIGISARAKHYWLFGAALAGSGKYDMAIQQFNQAKKQDPHNQTKYDLLIARVQHMQGKLVEARNKLKTISTESDPGDEILVKFELKLCGQTQE
jgi:GGDEF domain-containing protein